ncbi:MAG: hypothetical protein PHR53_04120 [Bacteroidales bacterium]|nr:hypothetical protein [Bacteroidales bacterium]
MDTITLILVLTPSILMLLVLFFFLWRYDRLIMKNAQQFSDQLDSVMKMNILQQESFTKLMRNAEVQKLVVPIRLQAYERLLLYLERIQIEGLVMRVSQIGMNTLQLQSALIRTIREEFEHNISQQLYVTDVAWEQVKEARERIVQLINIASKQVENEDESMKLVSQLFDYSSEMAEYQISQQVQTLKDEMRKHLDTL